jgi:hypothetical protein
LPSRTARVVGTYFVCANQKGGGDHVANAAYVTLPAMRGRGTAGRHGEAMLRIDGRAFARRGDPAGFSAMQFNFVVSSNAAAVHLGRALGSRSWGGCPALSGIRNSAQSTPW